MRRRLHADAIARKDAWRNPRNPENIGKSGRRRRQRRRAALRHRAFRALVTLLWWGRR